MMRYLFTLLAASMLVAVAGWQPQSATATSPVRADDKAAPTPLDDLEPRQRALVNATRWLLRPSGQEQAMSGLFYEPCPLPPITDEGKGKLTLPEVIRLWGVLESGYPDKAKLEPVVDRFRKTKAFKASDSLGPLAVQVLCARAAQRYDLLDERQYKSVLRDCWRTAESADEATSKKGPWLDDDYVHPQWYANVMWRAILLRCMIRAELTKSSKPFGDDLEQLLDLHARLSARFRTDPTNFVGEITDLLHANIFGYVALKLASEMPESAVSKSDAEKAKAAVDTAQNSLRSAIGIQWFARGGGAARAARGTLMQLIGDVAKPMGVTSEGFDSWLMGVQQSCQRLDGSFGGNATLCEHLGLASEPEVFTADYAALVETAMTVPLLAGGLFSDRKDLSGFKIEQADKLIAASIEFNKANAPRALATKFERRVAVAILDGCDYLAAQQTVKGGFGSDVVTRTGVHALCLMALLHGGRDRNSPVVQLGMQFLENNEWGFKDGLYNGYTYDAALSLMLMQLYYEPELKTSGMLEADSPQKYAEARKAMAKLIPEDHRKRIDQLLSIISEDRTGVDTGYTYRKYPDRELASRGDNSNSQYAMLGYKAGALLGAEFDPQVFLDEANRLLDQQGVVPFLDEVPGVPRQDMHKRDDQKKRTGTASGIKPGGWTYSVVKANGCVPQMTAAGISSLMTCMDELKLRGKMDAKTEDRIEAAITSSLATLQLRFYDAEGRNELWGDLSETADGWGLYYNLYSMERGCVLAGAKYLGGMLDWHTVGSEILCKLQRKDGSWAGMRYDGRDSTQPRPDAKPLIDTSLAILFLKAAAMPVITESKHNSGSDD